MYYLRADPFDQVVLAETEVYSWPYGMAGLADLGRHGHRGRRAKRLRPVEAKGRVFPAPPGGGRQTYQYGQDDAQQAVAAAEISSQQGRADRWHRPITAPSGIERIPGAVIGGGTGVRAETKEQRWKRLANEKLVRDLAAEHARQQQAAAQQATPAAKKSPEQLAAEARGAALRAAAQRAGQ